MPRYVNSFVEVSALGDFETQIQKLFRQLRANATKGFDTGTQFIDVAPVIPQDYNYSNILVDSGSGRITSGLKSLELLSILCSGTSPSNLFLFDNVIYAGSVNDFLTGNDDALVDLVIENLGMTVVSQSLSEGTTQDFKDKCLKIAKSVKTGKYTSDKYASYMKKECKRLVKLYLRLQ